MPKPKKMKAIALPKPGDVVAWLDKLETWIDTVDGWMITAKEKAIMLLRLIRGILAGSMAQMRMGLGFDWKAWLLKTLLELAAKLGPLLAGA